MKKLLITTLVGCTLLCGCSLEPFAELKGYSQKFTTNDPKTSYIKAINCVNNYYSHSSNAPMFSYQSDTLYQFNMSYVFYHTGFGGMSWKFRATMNYSTLNNEVNVQINNVMQCIDGNSECQSESRDGIEVNAYTEQTLNE